MYPAMFFGLFPPFPLTNRAFVAMSFDTQFTPRWERVIAPAIRSLDADKSPLEPHRVDLSRRGDSVLTEILQEISTARLIVADVTSLGKVGDEYIVRNHNVFYEVGLAHATRLPEEVILSIRSSSAPASAVNGTLKP